MLRKFFLAAACLLAASVCLAAGPYGGDVIDFAPKQGAAPVYCATSRGLFRAQEDGGWKRVDYFAARPIQSVATSGEVVVLVADKKYVYRSLDFGNTWELAKAGLVSHYGHALEEIYTVDIDPKDPRTIYLGSAKGFFTSHDGGLTWKLSNDALMENFPPVAQRAWVILTPAPGRPLMYGTPGAGLFRLQGDKWAPFGSGLPANAAVNALVASPKDPSFLALGTRLHGLWLSHDAGATWTLARKGDFGVVPAVAFDKDGALLASFAGEGLAVVREKMPVKMTYQREMGVQVLIARQEGGWMLGLNNQGILYINAKGALDGFANQGIDASTVHAFIDGKTPEEIWCGDDDGVYYSDNRGADWQLRNTGLMNGEVSAFLWSADDLFVGHAGQGIHQFDRQKNAWVDRGKSLGTANTIHSFFATSGGRFYVGTEGGILYSDNRGSDWVRANEGLPPTGYWALAQATGSDKTIYAASDRGLFLTKNGGESWSPLREGNFLDVRVDGDDLWTLEAARIVRQAKGQTPATVYTAERGELLHAFLPLENGLAVASSKGLVVARGASRTTLWSLSPVVSLYLDYNNMLWGGTDGYGAQTFKLP